jgi:hypothetical protein
MMMLIRQTLFSLSCAAVLPLAAQVPDISSVLADLDVPELSTGEPAAGGRVKQTHPDFAGTEVYHVLYLPKDWAPGKHYPVIVEYAGNGPYKSPHGDVSSGVVEGSRLGYGLSGGEGFIWLCLPYLNRNADANVTQWWGEKPERSPASTIDYCKKVVPWICEKYGGDPKRVVLAGFSRGAIACNYIGLHDDEIAKIWCGFVPFSHYDGVRRWGFEAADRASAKARLERLGNRPQFILGEGGGGGVDATRKYLESTGVGMEHLRFLATGFRNHNDAWILRPSKAREAVRKWLRELVE